jgi:hypothetical protein
MDNNTTVTPHIGFYEVSTVDTWGIQTHQVAKDKRCTCGGSVKNPCRHIQAVKSYLKAGGERAQESRSRVRVNSPVPGAPTAVPATCPVCEAPVVPEGRGRWRCPNSPSHYFEWRGDLNGGAIRKFLTQRHPNKVGGYYGMTHEERATFLEHANRLRSA